MIEDERLVWKALYDSACDGEMPGEEQQIVSEAESLQSTQPIEKAFAQHKLVIRFIVDHMSDTAEFRVLRKLFKLLYNAIAAEIYPAHYPADERILVRELQKPRTLFETLSSLYRDRGTDSSRIDKWQQIRRQVILPELVHAGGHPYVISVVIFPEMLVGIDFHRGHKPAGFELSGRCNTKPPPSLRGPLRLSVDLASL